MQGLPAPPTPASRSREISPPAESLSATGEAVRPDPPCALAGGRERGALRYVIVLESNLARSPPGLQKPQRNPCFDGAVAALLGFVQINAATSDTGSGTAEPHSQVAAGLQGAGPRGAGRGEGASPGVGRAGGWRAQSVGAVSKLGRGPGPSRLQCRSPAVLEVRAGRRGPAGARAGPRRL